jgi:hypothetical protein
MRQTQRETNNAQTRKIEQLIERKKSGEDKKKSVEHYLIFGIIAFCLTLLVVVVTSNDGGSSADKIPKNPDPKNTGIKDKPQPKPVVIKK